MYVNKRVAILVVLLIVVFIVPISVFAGPGDPGCDPLDPACPIDGGLSLLIAAGIGVGAKKAYDTRKQKKNKEE